MPQQKRSHYHHLKKKWLQKHKHLHTKLWKKHSKALTSLESTAKHFVVGSLASMIMMGQPVTSSAIAQNFPHADPHVLENAMTRSTQFLMNLSPMLPTTVMPLTKEQEDQVADYLSDYFGLSVSAELDGKRLNRSYGYIGAEQHLMRYPGDTMDTHFDTAEEQKYARSGMAPGRGAWGYFAPTLAEMTEKDKEREKYYIAVQTFLAPGFSDNVHEYYNFFKYRKMLVVNPDNGKAMVVVIGDAGPAPFTGKHLGGSPEVMSYLERKDGAQKGPVLYFFINDPEDKIHLGPIEIK